MNRRQFSQSLLAGALLPTASLVSASGPARSLSLLNLHTGESSRAIYWEQGRYLPDALAGFDNVLRDHRSGEVHAIDRSLFDLLVRLQDAVGNRGRFEVISGYRSPSTNAMLRRTGGGGVAKVSQHTLGKAIDIRLPGTSLAQLHGAARALQGGGVGLYERENFIHVDTARVRYW